MQSKFKNSVQSLVHFLTKFIQYEGKLHDKTIVFIFETCGWGSQLPFLSPAVPTVLCYVLCKPLLTFLSSQFASQAFRFTRYVPHYKCVSSLEGEFYWKTFWPPFEEAAESILYMSQASQSFFLFFKYFLYELYCKLLELTTFKLYSGAWFEL